MGQKVHPIGFRLGYLYDWKRRWFAKHDYAKALHEDFLIASHVKESLPNAAIADVVTERFGQTLKVNIYTARPGIVIGRSGVEVERLRERLQKFTDTPLQIEIHELRKPELCAQLVAENVALQINRRISCRRAMRRAVTAAMEAGAEGIKICCAGRLAGAEIARKEWYKEGRIPLATIKAEIDYGFAEAVTTYGKIGIKVWIYKGEVQPSGKRLGENIRVEEKKEYVDAEEDKIS